MLFDRNGQTHPLDAAPQPTKGESMTRITIPDKTPEHQACETALHVACDRIMHAEQEARTWRITAILATLVSLLALAHMINLEG